MQKKKQPMLQLLPCRSKITSRDEGKGITTTGILIGVTFSLLVLLTCLYFCCSANSPSSQHDNTCDNCAPHWAATPPARHSESLHLRMYELLMHQCFELCPLLFGLCNLWYHALRSLGLLNVRGMSYNVKACRILICRCVKTVRHRQVRGRCRQKKNAAQNLQKCFRSKAPDCTSAARASRQVGDPWPPEVPMTAGDIPGFHSFNGPASVPEVNHDNKHLLIHSKQRQATQPVRHERPCEDASVARVSWQVDDPWLYKDREASGDPAGSIHFMTQRPPHELQNCQTNKKVKLCFENL